MAIFLLFGQPSAPINPIDYQSIQNAHMCVFHQRITARATEVHCLALPVFTAHTILTNHTRTRLFLLQQQNGSIQFAGQLQMQAFRRVKPEPIIDR